MSDVKLQKISSAYLLCCDFPRTQICNFSAGGFLCRFHSHINVWLLETALPC